MVRLSFEFGVMAARKGYAAPSPSQREAVDGWLSVSKRCTVISAKYNSIKWMGTFKECCDYVGENINGDDSIYIKHN